MDHPDKVLLAASTAIASAGLPVVDHYAGSEKLMRKALALQQELAIRIANGQRASFDVTLDCEDGAATGSEALHAELVVSIANEPINAFNRIGVRIHDAQHPHCVEDLRLILPKAGHRLSYVTLPKVQSLGDLDKVVTAIERYAPPNAQPLRVQALIETQKALPLADAIAAHPRVEAIAFGVMDFVSDFNGMVPASAMKSPGQFDHPIMRQALTQLCMAAHRHGKCASASVTVDLNRQDQAYQDAKRGFEEFGFSRKWSIHPKQIEQILRAYRPDEQEVATASALLIAAQDASWGPIRFCDELHDRASYRYFWFLLKRAHQAGALIPSSALQRFFS